MMLVSIGCYETAKRIYMQQALQVTLPFFVVPFVP